MRHIKYIYVITALMFFIGLSAGITAGYGLAANIPMMIPYSGTIAVQGVPFNGNGQFKFAIINGHADCQSTPPVGGCVVHWSNDITSNNGDEPAGFVTIAVTGGSFGVKLGDPVLTNMVAIPGTVFDNGDVYLRVWFRDTGTSAGFERLTPDRQLVSVPYAFRADVANTVTGTAAVGTEQIADGAVTGDKIAPGAIAVNAGTGLTGGGTSGDVTLNVNLEGSGTATSVARSDHDHDAAYVNTAGDTMTGGLGLPLNGLTVGVNQLVASGGKIGIGTAAPAEQLEITGNLRLPATTATTGIIKSGVYTLIHSNGIGNFFAGISAGNLAMTGGSNTGSGAYSLFSNTTGNSNTANGASSLRSNTTGVSNTGSGTFSLFSNTTGGANTAMGASSLLSNTTGGANSASGAFSLYSNTTGNDNTAGGALSLFSNTTGSDNTASGALSLSTNTSGFSNTANGAYSLFSNTEGTTNTASGVYSLYSNTTGYANMASGSHSLYSNTEGYGNTATGKFSLYLNTTGSNNTASGISSLSANTTGFHNTVSGASSLGNNSTGNSNTAFGSFTGGANTTGSGNTFIGYNADASAGSLVNATAIGSGAVVDASNKVRIGNDNVTVIGGTVAWSNLSDMRTKKDIREIGLGLDFITSLRPVEFRMKEGDDRINLGFIAQDVEALLGNKYSVIGIGEDNDRILSLRYTDFIAPLVKAVQEQQTEIADLKARLTDQQNQIELLQQQFRNK